MTYLPAVLYAAIRRLVPIACVDLLPYRETPMGTEVGLIRRLVDGRGAVWNLVGGRVRYRETLHDAMDRHLRETLGPHAHWTIPDTGTPTIVAEYFPARETGQRQDPRKHAIALAYLVKVEGTVRAGGEAIDFKWFSPEKLPGVADIGYDQADVIVRVAASLRNQSAQSASS